MLPRRCGIFKSPRSDVERKTAKVPQRSRHSTVASFCTVNALVVFLKIGTWWNFQSVDPEIPGTQGTWSFSGGPPSILFSHPSFQAFQGPSFCLGDTLHDSPRVCTNPLAAPRGCFASPSLSVDSCCRLLGSVYGRSVEPCALRSLASCAGSPGHDP